MVDTLPLRTIACQCDVGYTGDARVECKLGKKNISYCFWSNSFDGSYDFIKWFYSYLFIFPSFLEKVGCSSDNDCAFTETCRNTQCVNPCQVGSPCALSAECEAHSHKATCRCPIGLVGDPFVNCYRGDFILIHINSSIFFAVRFTKNKNNHFVISHV